MKKIAFVTDTHFDEKFPIDCGVNAKENWDRIIAHLKSTNISGIVFGGDIGAQTSHECFFEALKDFSVKLILGNHDRFSQVSNFYKSGIKINELYYSFEDDYNKYLFLDSSSGVIGKKQLDWVKDKVETEKSLIVFIHHPIIEVETIIDKKYPLRNRKTIRNILKNNNQHTTIFSGHYHTNDEKTENNLHQIITQSSSYQIEKNTTEFSINNREFGYRVIEIEKNRINTEVITLQR